MANANLFTPSFLLLAKLRSLSITSQLNAHPTFNYSSKFNFFIALTKTYPGSNKSMTNLAGLNRIASAVSAIDRKFRTVRVDISRKACVTPSRWFSYLPTQPRDVTSFLPFFGSAWLFSGQQYCLTGAMKWLLVGVMREGSERVVSLLCDIFCSGCMPFVPLLVSQGTGTLVHGIWTVTCSRVESLGWSNLQNGVVLILNV